MNTPASGYNMEPLDTLADVKTVTTSAESVYSTDEDITLVDDASFVAGRCLLIDAQGHKILRLPLATSQLEIVITDLEGETVYTSTRSTRHSNDSILSHSKLGDLISTSYFFGPKKQPVMKMLQPTDASLDTVAVEGRWRTRATIFKTANGKSFEWFYYNRQDARQGTKNHVSVLALRVVDDEGLKLNKKEKAKSKPLAKLTRSDETRTQGTRRSAAGNGGRLELDAEATKYLDESVIVATCLMMLKKEVDRRRGLQFATLAGAIQVWDPERCL